MPHLQTQVCGHAILVNSENKILLLQNILHIKATHERAEERIVENKYVFPGGHLEVDENNPETALLREIKEETGITQVQIIAPVHTSVSVWGKSYSSFSVVYLAQVSGKEPVKLQANEAAGYKWCSWDEAAAMPMINREMLTALKKARKLSQLQLTP